MPPLPEMKAKRGLPGSSQDLGHPAGDNQDSAASSTRMCSFFSRSPAIIELRADPATGHKDCGEHHVDRLVLDGMQDRGERGHEHDLKQRRADYDARRDAQKIISRKS